MGRATLHRASAPGLRVELARCWHERLRGLLGRPPLTADEALCIEPCNSVHTFGIRVPIDVVFVAADGRVVKVVEALRPGRVAVCLQARRTLELAPGAARQHGLKPGATFVLGGALA